METPPPGIVVLFAGAICLAVVGLLVWILRSSGSKKQKEQDEQVAPLPFTEPIIANEQSFPSHIAEPAAAEDPSELLRVLRTEDGLVIAVRREPYRRLRDINDPRLGRIRSMPSEPSWRLPRAGFPPSRNGRPRQRPPQRFRSVRISRISEAFFTA